MVKNNYTQLINETFHENNQNNFDLLKKNDIKQERENEKKSPLKKSLKIYSHDGIEFGHEKSKKQYLFATGLSNVRIFNSFYSEKTSKELRNLDESIRKVSYLTPKNIFLHDDENKKKGGDIGELMTSSFFRIA